MKGNRRRDTKPERNLRSALFSRGLRYRVDHPIRVAAVRRPIHPDVVFTRAKVAVFVDGCFWHGCPQHGTKPQSNSEYWAAKLARNSERDRSYTELLEQAGWKVLRFWEHHDPEDAASAVLREITRSTLDS